MHASAFVATGTAGFLAGGTTGAVAGVLAWTVLLIARWRLRERDTKALPGPSKPQASAYAEIEDVIDRLDDIARERNWDLGKRFVIARMACENRTMSIDELERRYDQGLGSAPDKDTTEHPGKPGG
ncbi:MAG: hypothetical protein ACKVP2_05050 [Burkholderiales bacterium]